MWTQIYYFYWELGSTVLNPVPMQEMSTELCQCQS